MPKRKNDGPSRGYAEWAQALNDLSVPPSQGGRGLVDYLTPMERRNVAVAFKSLPDSFKDQTLPPAVTHYSQLIEELLSVAQNDDELFHEPNYEVDLHFFPKKTTGSGKLRVEQSMEGGTYNEKYYTMDGRIRYSTDYVWRADRPLANPWPADLVPVDELGLHPFVQMRGREELPFEMWAHRKVGDKPMSIKTRDHYERNHIGIVYWLPGGVDWLVDPREVLQQTNPLWKVEVTNKV